MKILLIGGAGLIGSRLENMLVDNGHETLVLDTFVGSSREFFNPKGKIITGNGCSFSVLNNVFSQFQPRAVFHLADNVIDKELNYSFELEADTCINVATNIMRCIRKYLVEYVFFGSSSEVYRGGSKRPLSEGSVTDNVSYTGTTKNYVENLFTLNSKKFGFKFVSLRYFGIYGERYFINTKHDVISFFVDTLVNGFPIAIVGPKTYLDVLSVDDAVFYTYKVLERVFNGDSMQIVNIGSGTSIKLIDVYKKVSETVLGEVVRPKYYKGSYQNRSLVADTKLIKSFGLEPTKTIDEIIEEIATFRGKLDGRH